MEENQNVERNEMTTERTRDRETERKSAQNKNYSSKCARSTRLLTHSHTHTPTKYIKRKISKFCLINIYAQRLYQYVLHMHSIQCRHKCEISICESISIN